MSISRAHMRRTSRCARSSGTSDTPPDFVTGASLKRSRSPPRLQATHLDEYLIFLHASHLAPHIVHCAAQVAKSLARLGYRKCYLAEEISPDFELPKLPQMVIATFSDEQLRALFGALDQRRWTGIRDRTI